MSPSPADHDHDHRTDRPGHHDHGHDHGHGHHGGHSHAPADFGTAFAIGIALNTGFVIAEATLGFLSNSMALVADAGHNLSDVLGLVVAWTAAILSKRLPSARYTYGLRGSSILAALFNAVFLLVAVGAIGWEAILRLFKPEPVAELTVMVVAAIGIVVNGVTAWLFAAGRKGDLNIRGAYLHMMADAAVSAGVVAAGLVILLTGWNWIDAVDQPGDRRGDHRGHLGAVARQRGDVAGRGAARHRSGRGARLSAALRRRGAGARSAHLADVDHRGGADLPSGDPRRRARRRLSARRSRSGCSNNSASRTAPSRSKPTPTPPAALAPDHVV